MNIIQAKHLCGISNKRYTYRLPDGIMVAADTLLQVENQKTGKPDIVRAVTNSEDVNRNTLDMIMQGQKVTSKVIGTYVMIPTSGKWEESDE